MTDSTNTLLLESFAQTLSIGGQTFKFPPLQVHKGSLVALLGQSGSGKSILLRQLAGLMSSSPTTVRHSNSTAFIFGRNGVFQHFSIRENMELCSMFASRSISDDDITDCLKRWKLFSVQHRNASQLTPQAMKVTQIARTTLLHPDLVFVEKPLIGLSYEQATQFIEWVDGYVQSGGILIYSEESAQVFRTLSPTYINLDGGDQNLRTIMNTHG